MVVGGCRWWARAGGRAVVIGRACGGRHRWRLSQLDDADGHSFGSECFEAEGPSRPTRNEGPENPKSMSDAGARFKQGAVQKISHQTSTSVSINTIWS